MHRYSTVMITLGVTMTTSATHHLNRTPSLEQLLALSHRKQYVSKASLVARFHDPNLHQSPCYVVVARYHPVGMKEEGGR
jgi:hypothetical protein